MVSTFTLNIVLSVYHKVPGQLSYSGLINFDKFQVRGQIFEAVFISCIKLNLRNFAFEFFYKLIGWTPYGL